MDRQAHELFEVKKLLDEQAQKYSYFFLAAATAAIGFSVNASMGHPLGWNVAFLGLAVLGFGGSFIYGCLGRNCRITMLSTDALRMEYLFHNECSGEELDQFYKEHSKQKEKQMIHINFYEIRQVQFFAAGVLFFVVWRVVEMYGLSSDLICLRWA